MSSVFGRSGTIYDAAPVHPITFKVGDPDLAQQLGGGFQAAHVWVNNPTNQALYFPDANDYCPAGISGRVFALQHTDIARASWTIPPSFGLIQPPALAGAAQLIFLNAGIEISPQAGTAASPTPPFPGSVVQTSTQLAQLLAPGNVSVNVPKGAQLQLIGAGITHPVFSFPSVQVIGNQTGFTYYNSILSGTVVLSIQAADTSVTVTWSGGGTSVTVNSLLNAIVISGSPANAPASWPGRYDGQAISVPAAGTQATVTLLASPTKRWMADHISAGMSQISGAATAQNLNLIDGVSGGASLLDQQPMGVSAVALTVDRLEEENLHFANALVNTALTAEFSGGVVGVAERVSLGAYLQ